MTDWDEVLAVEHGEWDEAERLRDENARLRELVRDMWLAANLADVQVHVKGGDWRSLGERVYDALGVEVDE